MKHFMRLAAVALAAATAAPAGTFYGLWWDGSNEHLVSLNPYTGTKTSIATIPDVKLVATANYAFDADSSRYAFVGGNTTSTLDYIVLDAPSGGVVARLPRTSNVIEMAYSPRRRMAYGLQWVAQSAAPGPGDSAYVPGVGGLKGKEYFVRLDPFTGAKDSTEIPGVKVIRLNSHVLVSDSGVYIFAGGDSLNVWSYYVIDVTTGGLLAKIPHSIKIDNPVYDPVRGAIHGLWWSDSSSVPTPPAPGDSAGIPPMGPRALRGTEYFVTLHPDSTLTRTIIPGVKYITFNRALDTDSGRYVFAGRDTANGDYYYVIDVETGAVLSQAAVSANVLNLAFAPSSSGTYPFSGPAALAARAPQARAWSLTPARGGIVELKFENPDAKAHAFSLLDLSGREALNRTGIRGDAVRVDVSGLKPGVYLFRLKAEGGARAKASGMLRVE